MANWSTIGKVKSIIGKNLRKFLGKSLSIIDSGLATSHHTEVTPHRVIFTEAISVYTTDDM